MDYQNKTVRRLGYLLPADESVFQSALRELIIHTAAIDSCFKTSPRCLEIDAAGSVCRSCRNEMDVYGFVANSLDEFTDEQWEAYKKDLLHCLAANGMSRKAEYVATGAFMEVLGQDYMKTATGKESEDLIMRAQVLISQFSRVISAESMMNIVSDFEFRYDGSRMDVVQKMTRGLSRILFDYAILSLREDGALPAKKAWRYMGEAFAK